MILVGLGCFDSYKFDYSSVSILGFSLDKLPQGLSRRHNEKSALVAAGLLRARGARIHSFRGLIEAKTRHSSTRMEFLSAPVGGSSVYRLAHRGGTASDPAQYFYPFGLPGEI